MKNKTIVVGMSGGVDSSVTAYLLKEQGYRVIGLFMKNWEEKDDQGVCLASLDYEDVVAVCNQIGIPHYSVNFSKEYWDAVFSRCLKEYAAGHTPNPDILCNKEIKFKCFLEKSLEMGADMIATGHYCRKIPYQESWMLARGNDPEKDQSYFLYTLNGVILDKVLFPLGDLKKSQVREIAKKAKLATAQKKDSTGICFIGKRNFKQFLNRYIENVPGEFRTAANKKIGMHDGVHCYTIGQRRGLDIGGPGEAWYVVGKDVEKNVVFVEQGEDHPSLYRTELTASEVNWIGHYPLFPFTCTAKIRYRSEDVACTVDLIHEGQIRVVFETMQKAVTSRQSIVFYKGELCLGGAIID